MNDKTQHTDDRPGNDHRAKGVLRQILADAQTRERSVFSEKTYADEPILTTGADFKRIRQQREQSQNAPVAERRAAEPHGRTPRKKKTRWVIGANPDAVDPDTNAGTIFSKDISEERAPQAPRPQRNTPQAPRPQRERITVVPDSFFQDEPIAPAHADLPETLQKLRALEPVRHLGITRHDETILFVRQAHIAATFTDDAPYQGIVPYHRSATYYDLNDAELRGYFTWRTQWLAGNVSRIPNAFARIRAAEIVNDIGVEAGQAGLRELQQLQQRSTELDSSYLGPSLSDRFAQWVRDYAIVHNLDATALVPQEEQSFAQAVAVLQRAEKTTLETGYRPLPAAYDPVAPKQVPAAASGPEYTAAERAARKEDRSSRSAGDERDGRTEPSATNIAAPTDVEVWHALCRIANYRPEKSPFLRTHETQAAAVAALVFERLVNYCALHTSLSFTEALVGRGSHRLFTPFLGLPYVPEGPQPDRRVRLTDASWAVRSNGHWRIRCAYGNTAPNKRLHDTIHAMDRHMRIDWQAGRPLKPRALSTQIDDLVAEASAEVRKRELEQAAAAEADKRRITFDLSKLGGIRADAAITRDALLVDEEIEDGPLQPKADHAVDETAQAQPAKTNRNEKGNGFGRPSLSAVAPDDLCPTASDEAKLSVPTPDAHLAQKADESIASPADSPETGQASDSLAPQPPAPEAANPRGLSDLEFAVLRRVLDGKPYDELLGPGAPMESVLIDAINEKLFDDIGDAVIEYADDHAQIIPDYREDVLDLLGQ